MPKKREYIGVAEAAYRLGMTDQAVRMWGAKPGAPVIYERGRQQYVWPDFARWYREQLGRDRRAERPRDLEEAKVRKLAAEAERAELELAKARGEVLPIAAVVALVRAAYDVVRARLVALPARLAPEVLGLERVRDAVPVIERAVDEILRSLAEDRQTAVEETIARLMMGDTEEDSDQADDDEDSEGSAGSAGASGRRARAAATRAPTAAAKARNR